MRPGPRVEQSRVDLERLENGVHAWLARRRRDDAKKRYDSQLRCLETVLDATLQVVAGGLDGIAAPTPDQEIYEACRLADRQMVFARRLWEFYREKWDQRDDRGLSEVLTAADEIVWSCYRPPFDHSGEPLRAPPLPYIVSDFSAYAVATTNVPPQLRSEDRLLRQTVEELPVPLIGLPYVCVAQPWWLTLVGHEVGHHVAYTVYGGAIPAMISDLVAAAARALGGEAGSEERWRRWSHELFADAYAVAVVGAAHVWLLRELLYGSDEAMTRDDASAYPPALVRIASAVAVMEEMGVASERALPRISPLPNVRSLSVSGEDRRRIEGLLAVVPAVVPTLTGREWAIEATLADLSGWSSDHFAPAGTVEWWQRQFAARGEPSAEPALEAPRLAGAGALAEWDDVVAGTEPAVCSARGARLRQRMLSVVSGCGEEGKRESAARPADVGELAQRIAREVSQISASEPE